eukprot:NODE_631_length_5776_cov_0.697199.p2 type:complete len:432 gc:universal NODE_631_length_5776_cov_0.697199:3444-4739(+)
MQDEAPKRKESLAPSKSLPSLLNSNMPKMPRSYSKIFIKEMDPSAIKLELSSILSIPVRRWEILNKCKRVPNINGQVGIINSGNTCFLNSGIQCLFHINELTSYFLNDYYKIDMNNSSDTNGVAISYAKLVKTMNTHTVVNAMEFKAEITKHLQYFEGFDMHDAQEFLVNLLDALSEDLNRGFNKMHKVKFEVTEEQEDNLEPHIKAKLDWNRYQCIHRSIIFDIFGGQFESRIECLQCKNKTYSFDMFWDISVPLKSKRLGNNDLLQCLDAFVEDEEMEYKCSKCHYNKASKVQRVYKWPVVLVLHLKRFYYLMGWNKNSSEIKFPRELSVSKWGSSINGADTGPSYKLVSCICHYGNLDYGHYISYCLDTKDNKWYCKNDDEVTEYNFKLHSRTPSFEFRKKKSPVKEEEFVKDLGKNVYILMYHRIDK